MPKTFFHFDFGATFRGYTKRQICRINIPDLRVQTL